ncbi:MAG: hypothetical protein QNJ00_17040 [Woeseiaceae bacterium]|nr:hypothetical protein [Woeseiaceae bacterium]
MIRRWVLYPTIAAFLIGLIYVALTFFMAAGVDIERVDSPPDPDRVEFVIVPTGANTVDVDGTSVEIASLSDTVAALLEEHRGKPVTFEIAAEQNTDTMLVVAIMEQLQQGGAIDVTIGGGQ